VSALLSHAPALVPPRRTRSRSLLEAAALLGAFPAAYIFSPLILKDSVIICPFRIATGLPCPFCGLTRSFACATHFHFHQAFALNPLWPVAAITIVVAGTLLLVDAANRSRLFPTAARFARGHWIWIVVFLAAFDVWRIVFFDRRADGIRSTNNPAIHTTVHGTVPGTGWKAVSQGGPCQSAQTAVQFCS
jgi:hypothetical protein